MISINWGTSLIYIPKADLTPLGGVFYGLDVDELRLALKDLEDDADGMPFQDTHNHNTEVLLAGVTYARTVEILTPYTVEFEDGQYVVVCSGANHNLADVKVPNQVSLIIGNSAGLQTVDTGTPDPWVVPVPGAYAVGTAGYILGHDPDPIYQAKGWVFPNATFDHYEIVWFKAGQPITTGITVPKIQVIKAEDGLDLVAETAMTQVGTTGIFKYDSTVKMLSGLAYTTRFSAVIDGATRVWYQPVGKS